MFRPEVILKLCGACGEIFYANIELEARHHAQPEHAPLLPKRSEWRQGHATMLARAC